MAAPLEEHDHIFRLLVESVTDYAIFLLDVDGSVRTWNTGAQKITGYSKKEIVGKHYSIFFPPADVAAGNPEVELHKARTSGRYEEEGWRVRKNGERFWANVIVTCMADDNGDFRGFAKVVRDLSERQTLRSALLDSEERFRLLVEGTQDYAIFMLDPDGHIQSWNKGVERIKGYTADDVIGRHFSMFYPEEENPPEKTAMELQVARETGRYQEEGWRVRKDGTLFWASVLITSLYDETGELRGFSKVTRDLTERRQADEALRHRTRQLEIANKSLEEFAYSVSHDLRAPLRALQGFSQALLEDCLDTLDEDGKEYAEAIHQGAANMDKLIQDLLTYSRLGMSDLQLTDVDLQGLTDEVLGVLQGDIVDKHAEIMIPKRLPGVRANRLVLSQVMTNLLTNALKFTSPGIPPRLTIEAKRRGQKVRILIQDEGIGVPEEFRQRIFKVFERLHGGETYPGTGIGLAIVARAVERMGGSFGIEPREPAGSTFWFELPAGEPT